MNAVHVIGRQQDLARREPRDGECRLRDVVERWSLAANAAWIDAGVMRRATFLQVSPPIAGSVLAFELRRLCAHGYVAIGPFHVPGDWDRDFASYCDVVRRVAAHVTSESAALAHGERAVAPPEFAPKAAAELEPLLGLWPHVVAVPTSRALSIDTLLRLRGTTIHPLGVVARPTFADGRLRSPAEFFFHDVDHARFKLREDLATTGDTIPDPYRDGTTFDAARGAHRAVLSSVGRESIAAVARRAPARRTWVARLRASVAEVRRRDPPLGDAMRWLLFEILHEKSHAATRAVLTRELSVDAHVTKLAGKCARAFHGAQTPAQNVVERLDDARRRLLRICDAAR